MKTTTRVPLPFVFAIASAVLFAGCPRDGICDPLPPAETTTPRAACADHLSLLQTRIERIFSNQQADGDIEFGVSDSVFYYHPLLSTFVLEVYGETRDRAFLERAHTVLRRYYDHLLVHHDRDGDFLVERTSSRRAMVLPIDIEDVGFNAMLALDMLSYSRICTELGLPLDALFWYQGAKTVSAALTTATYDPNAGFFLPTCAGTQTRESLYYTLSILPTYFRSSLGYNVSASVLRNYLLSEQSLIPETPYHYMTWGFSPADRLETDETGRLLRTLLLLGALEWNELDDEAEEHATRLRPLLGGDEQTVPDADGFAEFVRCALENVGPYAPFPRYHELDLIDNLVFKKSLLEGKQIAALRRSVAVVKRYLLSHGSATQTTMTESDAANLDNVTQSIRQVYWSISLLREKWRDQTLFPAGVLSHVSGFDVYSAISGLWDDVIATLQEAENRVVRTRWEPTGFNITATLQKESAGPAEAVPIRFAISALARPVSIRSIVLYRDQAIDTLLSSTPPFDLNPGEPPKEITYLYPTPKGPEMAILTLPFMADIRFEDGERFRYHFRKGVYVSNPVSFTVVFPGGTTLSGGSVPVEVHLKKHLSLASIIHVEWFSPAGLNPIEGSSIEARMPEHANDFTMTMNVLVPTPCRPGSFPFTLKVFANGEDIGTVTSRFFKHYQWLFVGPFPERVELLDARYPPESPINLFATYPSARGRASWRPLPMRAYADGGRLNLGPVLPSGGIGLLYTVIGSATQRRTAVLFESNSPAILYVNGDPLLRTERSGPTTTQRAQVLLNSGMNNVLIKTLSGKDGVVFLQLGDEEDLLSDEFNNNLWELVDGYEQIVSPRDKRTVEGQEHQRRVTLTYQRPDANSVSVIGSFNGWSPANSKMHKNKYGEWEINLFLPPGRYAYRFLVNNSIEVLDPASPGQEPDGYGGSNSVLNIE